MSASSSDTLFDPGLSDEILGLLRCPVTGGSLRRGVGVLICAESPGLRYPISGGVPHLLPDARR